LFSGLLKTYGVEPLFLGVSFAILRKRVASLQETAFSESRGESYRYQYMEKRFHPDR
jgi:hypothetical protein